MIAAIQYHGYDAFQVSFNPDGYQALQTGINKNPKEWEFITFDDGNKSVIITDKGKDTLTMNFANLQITFKILYGASCTQTLDKKTLLFFVRESLVKITSQGHLERIFFDTTNNTLKLDELTSDEKFNKVNESVLKENKAAEESKLRKEKPKLNEKNQKIENLVMEFSTTLVGNVDKQVESNKYKTEALDRLKNMGVDQSLIDELNRDGRYYFNAKLIGEIEKVMNDGKPNGKKGPAGGQGSQKFLDFDESRNFANCLDCLVKLYGNPKDPLTQEQKDFFNQKVDQNNASVKEILKYIDKEFITKDTTYGEFILSVKDKLISLMENNENFVIHAVDIANINDNLLSVPVNNHIPQHRKNPNTPNQVPVKTSDSKNPTINPGLIIMVFIVFLILVYLLVVPGFDKAYNTAYDKAYV
jgi:hypothetical protein